MSFKRRTNEVDRCIGKNMKILRAQRGLSQGDLSEILDVTFQQVQKYELGLNRLSAASLYKLALHFDVSLDSFFIQDDGAHNLKGHAPEFPSADLRKIIDIWQKLEDKNFKKLVINLVNEKTRERR